jgi:hypothetical protein
MIPLIVFVALLLMLIPLFLYAFIDHSNKLYANIIAAFLCSIIAIYLSVVISVGIVQYDSVPMESANGCTICAGAPIQDVSVGYVLLIIGVIMMIYALYMVYEAYDEHRLQKEEEG